MRPTATVPSTTTPEGSSARAFSAPSSPVASLGSAVTAAIREEHADDGDRDALRDVADDAERHRAPASRAARQHEVLAEALRHALDDEVHADRHDREGDHDEQHDAARCPEQPDAQVCVWSELSDEEPRANVSAVDADREVGDALAALLRALAPRLLVGSPHEAASSSWNRPSARARRR